MDLSYWYSISIARNCETCTQKSQCIYDCGWMCLNPKCLNFWQSDDEPPPRRLTYDVGFLTSQCKGYKQPAVPIRPIFPLNPITNTITSAKFWQGWWCKQCGKLSCRYVSDILHACALVVMYGQYLLESMGVFKCKLYRKCLTLGYISVSFMYPA